MRALNGMIGKQGNPGRLHSYSGAIPSNRLLAALLWASAAGLTYAAPPPDTSVIGKETWLDHTQCAYAYSPSALLLSKACSDSTGKKRIKEIDYSYDTQGRLQTEECISDSVRLTYRSVYTYDQSGRASSKTTGFDNPTRTVITSYHYGAGNQLLSEAERYPSGTLVESLSYVYEGARLSTKEVYDYSSAFVGEQQQSYDNGGKLVQILFYSGSQLLALTDLVAFTYLPLSQVSSPTPLRILKSSERKRGVGSDVLLNGRAVKSRGQFTAGKVFHHD